jgi:hypothetical protein
MQTEPQDPARHLAGGVEPSPALKQEVLQTLRARGLLAPVPRPRRAVVRTLASTAAGLALFAAGVAVGGRRSPAAPDPRPRFALLLYEDAAFRPAVSHRELVAEYSAWADSLRGQRALVMGEELDSAEAAVLVGTGGVVTWSPGDVESVAGRLAGFFIVRASTTEDALAIARRCPHLKYGGRVALRRLTGS